MIRDGLIGFIHEIGQSKHPIFTTVRKCCDKFDCSRAYANYWLAYYCDGGKISRVRVKYKNTVMDYYTATHQTLQTVKYLEEILGKEVLEFQRLGEWFQVIKSECEEENDE